MRLVTFLFSCEPHLLAALDESDIQILKTYVRANLSAPPKILSNWSIRVKVPTPLS